MVKFVSNTFLTYLFLLITSAQGENFNLVRNPGFEDLRPGFCPYDAEQLDEDNVQFWEGTDSEIRWGNCGYGTDNFFPAPRLSQAAPQCERENADSYENNAYAGFWTIISMGLNKNWSGLHRSEYIGGYLYDSLRPNIKYDISYDIALGRWDPDPLLSSTSSVTRLKSVALKFLDRPYSNEIGVNNFKLNYHYDPPLAMPNDDFYFPTYLLDQATGAPLHEPSPSQSATSHLVGSPDYANDQDNPWIGLENGEVRFDKWYTIKGEYISSYVSNKKNFLIGNFHDFNSDPLTFSDQNIAFAHFRPYLGEASVRNVLAYYFIDNVKISCTPEVGIAHPDGRQFPQALGCDQSEDFLGEFISNVDQSPDGFQWEIKVHGQNNFCSAETSYTFNYTHGNEINLIDILTTNSADSQNRGIQLPLTVGPDEYLSVNFQGRCHVSSNYKSPFYGQKKSFRLKPSETDLRVTPDRPALYCGDNPSFEGVVIDGNEHRWQAAVTGTQNVSPWVWGQAVGGTFRSDVRDIVSLASSQIKLVEGSELKVGFQGRCDGRVIRNDFSGKQKVHQLIPPGVQLQGPSGEYTCQEFSQQSYFADVINDPNSLAKKSWRLRVTFADGSVYENEWRETSLSNLSVSNLLAGAPAGKELNGANIELSYGAICEESPLKSDLNSKFLSSTIVNETATIQVSAKRSQFRFQTNAIKVTDLDTPVKFKLTGAQGFDDISWSVYGPFLNPSDAAAGGSPIKVVDPGSENFSTTFSQLGYYRVVAGGNSQIGNTNCANNNEVIILVLPPFYFPNALSPNNDGENDKYGIGVDPGLSGMIKSFQFSIFDRWGNQVHTTNDFDTFILNSNEPSQGWDGTFRGKEMGSGVFVYTLKLELIGFDQVLTAEGEINLLR